MAGGMNALLDGYRGSLTYLDGRWQGYLDNLDCVIDMGEITDLHKVSSRWMQLTGPGVYQPTDVELLTSDDVKTFTSRGTMPKLDTLESLCYALDKPLAALLFDVDENKLTGEEIQLLSRWKQLDIRQKKVIMDTIEAFGKTE